MDEFICQRRKSSQKKEDLLQNLIDGKIEAARLNVRTKDLYLKQVKEEDAEHMPMDNAKNFLSLSDERINGVALSYIVGGYDTTSTALAWTTYFLAKHTDVQEKARKELKSVINFTGKIEYDDLAKLVYLDQIISETLRLHSLSSLATNRVVKKTFTYNGMTIPKDITVVIPVIALHKDPIRWPDPNKFDPDRFSFENKKNINFSIYQPFGNGPRMCVGMRFAQTIMKFTLARLLLTFRFEMPPNFNSEKIHSFFLIHPKEVFLRTSC